MLATEANGTTAIKECCTCDPTQVRGQTQVHEVQAHPGVGVPSSRVEAVLVPLVSVFWEGMTSDRVTLVLLVL